MSDAVDVPFLATLMRMVLADSFVFIQLDSGPCIHAVHRTPGLDFQRCSNETKLYRCEQRRRESS